MDIRMLEDLVMVVLGRSSSMSAEFIRETIRKFAGEEFSEDQLESLARSIERKVDITMRDCSIIQTPFEPWLEGRRASADQAYWERYRRYLQQKGFPPQVLGQLEKDTDRITGLLEDPAKSGEWKRRGLVVGHVQSGKTASYIGVASKASDFGYRFIVLLAGMQNNLRRQTQERVELGFTGINSDALRAKGAGGDITGLVGVGMLDGTRRPISVTSRTNDFLERVANTLGISFRAVNEPIVLVMKKNVSVMRNLVAWLRNNNPSGDGLIRGVPMLLIDDEADNASVNTKAAEGDVTAINAGIRELLNMFEQNCYLGYTATPFANIFIDPDREDEMLKDDIFPRDFIISLEAPTNYAGASRIFPESGDLHYMLEEIDDAQDLLPENHRISHQVDALPESLREAIRCFVIACTIRASRGQMPDHNSMLVNVSRFNEVQRQVSALIALYLTDLRRAVQLHAGLDMREAMQDPHMLALHATWQNHYHDSADWAEVQSFLGNAIGPISVMTINGKSTDRLSYDHPSQKHSVIAVGGLSLSRGFTLEGLMVSYFLRNSIMYDTLMQMGRWFGYRDGFEDLCRIFMTPAAISWYSHISLATDELRDELRLMELQGKRPVDFGLRVRAHPDSLIVTARNKMRSGKEIYRKVSLHCQMVETAVVNRDHKSLERNFKSLEALITAMDAEVEPRRAPEPAGTNLLWAGVPVNTVCDFIRGFANHDRENMPTQSRPLLEYIGMRAADELAEWDVCLFNPERGKGEHLQVAGHTIRQVVRMAEQSKERNLFRVSGASAHVISRGDEKIGLTVDQIQRAEEEAARELGRAGTTNTAGRRQNISDRFYRAQRTRPLLMLYILQLHDGSRERIPLGDQVVAYAISFPPTSRPLETVSYVVNTTWWKENYGDLEQEEEDELDQSVA